MPAMMLMLMTNMMVPRAEGSSAAAKADRLSYPAPVAARSAAISSYWREPTTDRRNQGQGAPSRGAKENRPMITAMEGTMEKATQPRMAELKSSLETPSSRARLRPRRKKIVAMTSTIRMPPPTRAYSSGLFRIALSDMVIFLLRLVPIVWIVRRDRQLRAEGCLCYRFR